MLSPPMAKAARRRSVSVGILAWVIAIILFSPILWMILTSFKTELDAVEFPPSFIFEPTLENFGIVQERSNYLKYAANSTVLSFGSTFLGILIGVTAAWAMAFLPGPHTKSIMLWMLSTKMMPAVGVLLPIYLIFCDAGLLDTLFGLTIVLMLMNLPIIIWMLYTYFTEIHKNILEAARIDGARLWDEIIRILLPLSIPGIVSTVLLNVILAWNESFWTLFLDATDSAPLTAFIASYSSPEGLFWAKLSAASTLAIAPVIVLGRFSQKQLVRGLTFGSVK